MTKKVKATKTTKNTEIADTATKVETTEKSQIEQIKEPAKVEKHNFYYLASKADHIIEVQYRGQTAYIQPFGKIKVIKEQLKVNSEDTRYLTFIKI